MALALGNLWARRGNETVYAVQTQSNTSRNKPHSLCNFELAHSQRADSSATTAPVNSGTVAIEPESAFSIRAMIESVIEMLSSQSDDAVVPLTSKLNEKEAAFFQTVFILAQPVLDAQNVPDLRQTLGDVVLSHEYTALERGISDIIPNDALEQLMDLAKHRPIRPFRALNHQLGPEVAELLEQACDLLLEILDSEEDEFGTGARKAMFTLPAELPPPSELSKIRRRLTLGDEVSAEVSAVLLSKFRGELAFLILVGSALRNERIPNWKGIALGELAVAGMQSLRRFVLLTPDHIDLEVELKKHEAFKAELFEQLLRDGNML